MKYIAIYDVRLLPLALGDMVSWLAHHRLVSQIRGYEKFDVAIIFPNKFSGNLLNEVRGHKYWAKHLEELKAIFLSEESVERCIILNSLQSIPFAQQYENSSFEVEEISKIIQNLRNRDQFWSYVRKFQKYDIFNKYFLETGNKIILTSKESVVDEANKILDKYSNQSNFVICQPRFRMIDKGLPLSDPRRDSDFFEWYHFFGNSSKEFPNIKFVIIGREQSIPSELCNFGNAIQARNLGLNLGHEIALIRSQKLFLGASSGFAVVANFSDTPYTILNVKLAGLANFGVGPTDSKLVFASEDQWITQKEISSEVLYKHLKRGGLSENSGSFICVKRGAHNLSEEKNFSEFKYIFKLINNHLDNATKIYNEKSLMDLKRLLERILVIWKYNIKIQKLKSLNPSVTFFYLKFIIKLYRLKIRFLEYYEVIRKYNNQNLLIFLISEKIRSRFRD